MSGIYSAINTALTGLEAFETGINTVSNNIANANTDGYASESVNIQSSYLYPGDIGSGVDPAQIIRASSGLAAAQLRTANTTNSAASAQSSALTNLSNALSNNGNIQTSISQFFSDVSSLAANPTSAALRQTVLSDAQSVTSSFQSAATNMSSVITGAQTNLLTGVAAANGLLSQLSNINQSLRETPNSPSLLDQQQSALNSLSQYLPVNAITQSNGSVILASGGTILLDQSGAQSLNVSSDSNGNPVVTAGLAKALVTLMESDGSLGASLGTIDAGHQAVQSLNMVATSFATQVNQAQAQGLDASGNLGSNMFTIPAPTVAPGSANTGTAQMTATITNTANLPSNGGPLTLTFNGTNSSGVSNWSVVNQASGETSQVTGIPPELAGFALSMSGTVQNGDSFILNPAPNASTAISVAATSSNAIAAADPYVGSPGALPVGAESATSSDGVITNSNKGTITTGADSVVTTPDSGAAVVPASYFGQNLQINFGSSGSYTVSVAGTTTPAIASGSLTGGNGTIAIQYPSSGASSGGYWQLPISGTPVAGDTLTLQPGGSSSGSNAQRMAGLWTAPNTTSSGSLEQNVVGLATGLGQNASAAQQLATATSAQVTTATANLSAVSGVNTDQQAVLLTNYQQAYQAAAQVITTARSMFESLISAV